MDTPLSVARIRALDRYTIETVGIPGRSLMEVAGFGAARLVLELRQATGSGAPVRIATGSGNNAGDGFVVARWLRSLGCPVTVHALVPPASFPPGDARANAEVLSAYGILPEAFDPETFARLPASVAVDALLGTGLRGPVRPPFREAIEAFDRIHAPTVSLDLPSGLDGDDGSIHGAAVRADVTVTFGALKTGFTRGSGPRHSGVVRLVPLPFPPDLPDPLSVDPAP